MDSSIEKSNVYSQIKIIVLRKQDLRFPIYAYVPIIIIIWGKQFTLSASFYLCTIVLTA